MYCSHIQITGNQKMFYLGDTITGTGLVTVPKDTPLSSVSVSFHCRVGLKWINVVNMLNYEHNHYYYEKNDILDQESDTNPSRVFMSLDEFSKKITIPFSFPIPKNKGLPSTLVNSEVCVKYFICLTVKFRGEKTKRFYKEVIVSAPFYKNLMIPVAATAEKSVFLHSGTVSLHASIYRKGFAPGETITVQVTVHNQTNTAVVPKMSLNQTQTNSFEGQVRIIENMLQKEPITGNKIEPHSKVQELLNVTVPQNESLSIKSALITVKYFIDVTLDIPYSFALHVTLPLIVTTKTVIEQLEQRKNDQMAIN